jgi:hypothetical protein
MIFMSDQGAWVMGHATEIFMDGTFDSRPSMFAQLYFIRAKMADKRCVAVAFALLPNKETTTYRHDIYTTFIFAFHISQSCYCVPILYIKHRQLNRKMWDIIQGLVGDLTDGRILRLLLPL